MFRKTLCTESAIVPFFLPAKGQDTPNQPRVSVSVSCRRGQTGHQMDHFPMASTVTAEEGDVSSHLPSYDAASSVFTEKGRQRCFTIT